MTVESRAKPKMTGLQLVAEWLPGCSAKHADSVLWELTSFPLGSLGEIEGQLAELALEWDAEERAFRHDVFKRAHDEMDRAMEAHRAEEGEP